MRRKPNGLGNGSPGHIHSTNLSTMLPSRIVNRLLRPRRSSAITDTTVVTSSAVAANQKNGIFMRLIPRFYYLTIAFLAALPLFATPPTVTITGTSWLSHSVVEITFDTSGSYSDVRTRYIVSPGTCTGGTGGTVLQKSPGIVHFTSGMVVDIAGLTPATTYNACIEVTDGSTWSTGTGTSFTTLAAPAVDPAPPTPPQTFNTDYPDTGSDLSGKACGTAVSNTGYCEVTVTTQTELQNAINDWLSNGLTRGSVVYIPAGSTIKPTTIQFNAQAPDAVQFQPTDVDTTNNWITSTAHGLTDKQQIQFGGWYGVGATFPATSNGCDLGITGIQFGHLYRVAVVDANHFGVYCNDGTTRLILTSQGSIAHFFLYQPLPHRSKKLIIRSSAPDSELPPVGVRITPAWHSKMATLMNPVSNFGTGNNWIVYGDGDNGDQWMVGNIIWRGIEFTTEDAPESHLSTDPQMWGRMFNQVNWNSSITYDQCWIHGQGVPNRTSGTSGIIAFRWDGAFNAIQNSYLSDLVYPRAVLTIVPTLTDSTHIKLAAGTQYVAGQVITLASDETLTFSGSPSGSNYGLGYFDFLNSNALTVAPPAGVTVSCSGPLACVSVSPGSDSGTCDYSAGWPKDSYTSPSVSGLFCLHMSGSSINDLTAADITTSHWLTDTDQFMIGGTGPGPWKFYNNTKDSPDLWHHDEGGLGVETRSDFDYRRNTFSCDLKYMYGSSTSDHYWHFLRQPLEWKGGWRISLVGNIFQNCWLDETPANVMVAFTSVTGQGIMDVNMEYNTFRHGQGVTNVPLQSGNGLESPPPARFHFANNLIYDIGDPKYQSSKSGQFAPTGWLLQGGGAGEEDTDIEHNTVVGVTGRNPSIMWVQLTQAHGVKVQNNIFGVTSAGGNGIGKESGPTTACTGTTAETLATCTFTPSYVWDHNLFLSPDESQATVQGVWPGGLNFIPSDMSLNSTGWYKVSTADDSNYRIKPSSVYISGGTSHGSDGLDIGANIDALEQAQGHVIANGITGVTTTAAQVNFVAPDTQACPVYLATSVWPTDATGTIPTFTIAADSGTLPGARHVALTSLAAHTVYHAKIMCAVEQPELLFKTN